MPDFVVGFRELFTALPACCCAVVVCLLCVCQRRLILVVGKYSVYYFTFMHYMLVKYIHYPRSTVHDAVGLVFWVFANPATCKATDVVFVNQICCFLASTSSSWSRDEKELEVAN